MINKEFLGTFGEIKHISFDFWNTLVYPNPEYAKARNNMLLNFTNNHIVGEATIDYVNRNYTMVKKTIDQFAEDCGRSFKTEDCIRLLLSKLVPDLNMQEREQYVTQIALQMQTLFKLYPPNLLPETVEMVSELGRAYSLSITSNTNFISGSVIGQLLDFWGMRFGLKLFSDSIAYAKPHPYIFRNIIKGDAKRDSILHIGDHPICDGHASKYGYKTLIIKDPADLVLKLTK